MTLPQDVTGACLEILSCALERARYFAEAGQGELCAAELSHVLNLPSVLRDPSLPRFRYYLEAEVPSYQSDLRRLGASCGSAFDSHWGVLRRFVELPT